MLHAPPCPRCQEFRLTEIITTKATRVAFCKVCSHSWPYDVAICTCAAVSVPHLSHDYETPRCPQCGKRAQMTRPT